MYICIYIYMCIKEPHYVFRKFVLHRHPRNCGPFNMLCDFGKELCVLQSLLQQNCRCTAINQENNPDNNSKNHSNQVQQVCWRLSLSSLEASALRLEDVPLSLEAIATRLFCGVVSETATGTRRLAKAHAR